MHGGKWTTRGRIRRLRLPLFLLLPSLGMGIAAAGCATHPTTQPSTASQRADEALRDPFGYNPQSQKYPDVSGGDLGHFDKNAMKKDLDDVLNP